MSDSIFTQIIRGDIPSHKVYEDGQTYAFMDIHPINSGHIVLVPKVQVDHMWDLSDEDYHYLWSVAKHLAAHVRTVLGCPRVGAVVEGFGVPHAHINIVPLYTDKDLLKVRDMDAEPDHPALAAMAERLKL